MLTVTILIPKSTYDRAASMTRAIEEDYKLNARLAKREDLADKVSDVTAEGVLSLAAVVGINHLMRPYGWTIAPGMRGLVDAGESIAIKASLKKASDTEAQSFNLSDLSKDELGILDLMIRYALKSQILDDLVQRDSFRRLSHKVYEEMKQGE